MGEWFLGEWLSFSNPRGTKLQAGQWRIQNTYSYMNVGIIQIGDPAGWSRTFNYDDLIQFGGNYCATHYFSQSNIIIQSIDADTVNVLLKHTGINGLCNTCGSPPVAGVSGPAHFRWDGSSLVSVPDGHTYIRL